MKLFISYSSKDRELVETLAEELDYLEHSVWFDRELNRSGGQKWWTLICEQIRACEGFIYALSPHVSVPCQREYQYARDLGKPVLPLVVADLDYRYLPVDLQAAQRLQFKACTLAEKKALRESLRHLPPCPPLPPNARQLEPAAPLDPVGVLIDRIRTLTADSDQQKLLILDIDALREDAQHAVHMPELLRLLLAREDVLTVSSLRLARKLVDTGDTMPPVSPTPPLPRIELVAPAVLPKLPFTLPLLEWIDIPAGKVILEKGWNVSIGRYSKDRLGTFDVAPFKITRYPVTNAQFQAFIDDGGYDVDRYWKDLAHRDTAPNSPQWNEPTHPRETVNWFESMAFTRWLSEKTRLVVTLPTEMQWQWAAVGDMGWAYPYGETFDAGKCNTRESGIDKTTPVDRYPQGASPYGVMDLSGNVWEWCLNNQAAPSQSGISGLQVRDVRGGSWGHLRSNARVAYRGGIHPASGHYDRGFRVVVVGRLAPSLR